jgi:hypothetical protein
LFDLKVKRAISESIAAFGAFAACGAKALVDGVLEVWVFYVFAIDGSGRAKEVFGGGVEVFDVSTVVTATEVAITADAMRMDTAYCRDGKHAVGLAPAAKHAFLRVYLPIIVGIVLPAEHLVRRNA